MLMSLAGKSAVITGSSAGIGRAIALLLAEQGANVVINGRGSGARGQAAIDSVVEEIRAKRGQAIGIAGAVDDPAVAESLVSACVKEFGGIHVLVNNAGIFNAETNGPVHLCSLQAWHETIAINLNAVFYVSRVALRYMKRQRWGRILNAASLAGTGAIGGSAYVATKSALFGLTRAMAGDYGPWGITVNAYNPEADTDMSSSKDPAGFAAWMEVLIDRGFRTPAECRYSATVGGPEGVAPFVAYLCSDEAEYLNGHVFALEGRRIALLSSPAEGRTLFRDFAAQGPWSIEELARLTPLIFQVSNQWPKRTEAQLRAWEERPPATF